MAYLFGYQNRNGRFISVTEHPSAQPLHCPEMAICSGRKRFAILFHTGLTGKLLHYRWRDVTPGTFYADRLSRKWASPHE